MIEIKIDKDTCHLHAEGARAEVAAEFEIFLNELYRADKEMHMTVLENHLKKLTGGELDGDD